MSKQNVVDRISNLPEPLLCHILSFLPTKYALRTSILSLRWKHIWTKVPILHFHDERKAADTSFVEFVDRVLILHDVSNIECFHLSCAMDCTISHINTWISAAIRRNVRRLDVVVNVEREYDFDEPYLLPFSLFSCESLTTLNLDMVCFLKPPASVYLPKLKILSLESVNFCDENATQGFFSGCPILEELTIQECTWIKTVHVSFPALTKLTITFNGLSSTEFYEDCKVNIYAPNLSSFMYEGSLPIEYSLYNLSSVVDAYIKTQIYDDAERFGKVSSHACELLKGLCRVEELTLSHHTIQAMSHATDLVSYLPTFYNLTYLQVLVDWSDCSFQALMVLLQRFPKLEYLVFSQGFSECVHNDMNNWMLKLAPQCFATSLKEIEFWEFSGMEHELRVLSFFLKNSVKLERMTINYAEDILTDLEKKATAKEEVLMLPRYSPSAVIMFS